MINISNPVMARLLACGITLQATGMAEVAHAPPTPPPAIEAAVPEPESATQPSRGPTAKSTPATLNTGPVSTWRERAEDDSQVTATLASARPVVQGTFVAEGTGAFQLANPAFTDESIVLGPGIIPGADTSLFFESRLGYATSAQFARVQVSTNGTHWTNLWSRAGSGGAGDGGFRLETLPLAAYAGTTIRIRFLYDFIGGTAYTGTDPGIGWHIDDIQIGATFIKRPYLETGDPTADEILMLEFINRARANANAEAARLASTTDPDVANAVAFFNVDFNMMSSQFAALAQTTQPLAMNARLLAAARLHSRDMLDNVFQGHSSSANPPAPNMPYDNLANRLSRQGYPYSTAAENVFSYAENPWHGHAGFNIDWGNGPGGMQSPAGHRLAIHNAVYREVGIGVIAGSKTSGLTTVGPLLVTQNFGAQTGGGQALVTGVAFLDGDADGFYDPSEGIANVRVEVDGSSYNTLTSTHGAYAVPVASDGIYRISFIRPGHPVVSRDITVDGGLNVKADYRGESVLVEKIERPTPSSVRLTARPSGPQATLSLQSSADLISWSTLPHTQATLPGGLLSLDATLPSPQEKLYFRIHAVWNDP